VGGKTTKTLIDSVLILTTRAVGTFLPIKKVEELQRQLQIDYIITNMQSTLAVNLALKCAELQSKPNNCQAMLNNCQAIIALLLLLSLKAKECSPSKHSYHLSNSKLQHLTLYVNYLSSSVNVGHFGMLMYP